MSGERESEEERVRGRERESERERQREREVFETSDWLDGFRAVRDVI